MSASYFQLSVGEETELRKLLARTGWDAPFVRKLIRNPAVAQSMIDHAMTTEPFRLIHGMWTSIDDLLEIVRGYDGVDGAKIDAALKTARDNGTFEAINQLKEEKPEDRLVAPVINVHRPTVHETLLFGRSCAQQVWTDKYNEWEDCYAQGVDENRVKLIPGARPFISDEVAIRIVDFGANWNRQEGIVLSAVQETQAARLAGFEVIFAMSQHPEWVRQMDGDSVPYALAAALLLNVPYCDPWTHSPRVWLNAGGAELHGAHVAYRFHRHSMAVVREYKS